MVLALPRRRPADPLFENGVEKIEVAVMLNERDMREMEADAVLQFLST